MTTDRHGASDTAITTLASRLAAFPLSDYDAYVASHPRATPYHCSAWLVAVQAGYGHRAWIVSAHRGERLCGILPIVEVRRPFGPRALVALPFCDLGGPLADDSEAYTALEAQALRLAQTLKVQSIELRQEGLMMDPEAERDIAVAPAKVRMLLPLPDSADTLFQGFSAKLRSQIRKAEKNGLTAEIVRGADAITAFYRVYADNMHRLGSPAHSLRWYLALGDAYGEDLRVGLVRLEHTVVGAGIVLIEGNRACIPWASTLAEYNRLAPNMLLYWTLLSQMANGGVQTFDFGRSTPGEGTYRFKKQWGAQPQALDWRTRTVGAEKTPPHTRASAGPEGRLRAVAEQLWRRMPLSMATWLGPKLRRYITL
ncbi:FemAB family XrtA/PEP-CTERM system-associated protein [Marinobacter sp. C2H3]|uniref:FemAB family XrtA/PEP-CTERM system-associated protein n=1 Tax=Marinobacter sp. C2H3 TaxID=3119003 RepID=UPI00300F4892